jgi:hypothetical protein
MAYRAAIKNFKFIIALLSFLPFIFSLYLINKSAVEIEMDTLIGIRPALNVIEGRSPNINLYIEKNVKTLSRFYRHESWFPIGYRIIPYWLSSTDSTISTDCKMAKGLTITRIIFTTLSFLFWIFLAHKIFGIGSWKFIVICFLIGLQWPIIFDTIGGLYEWAITPLFILLGFSWYTYIVCENSSNKYKMFLSVILGFLFGFSILLKYSLAIHSISIISSLGLIFLVRSRNQIKYLIVLILSFIFTYYCTLTITIENRPRPAGDVIQNILKLTPSYYQQLSENITITMLRGFLMEPYGSELFNKIYQITNFKLDWFIATTMVVLIFILLYEISLVLFIHHRDKNKPSILVIEKNQTILTIFLMFVVAFQIIINLIIPFWSNEAGGVPRFFISAGFIFWFVALKQFNHAGFKKIKKTLTLLLILLTFVCSYRNNLNIVSRILINDNILNKTEHCLNLRFQNLQIKKVEAKIVELVSDPIIFSTESNVLLLFEKDPIYRDRNYVEESLKLIKSGEENLKKVLLFSKNDDLLLLQKSEEVWPETKGRWKKNEIKLSPISIWNLQDIPTQTTSED